MPFQRKREQPARSAAASPPSLTRNFLWVLFGNVTGAGCQWLILVSIAKLGTPSMVGQFAYGLAVTAPVVLFANLQLRAVLATETRAEFSFRAYCGMRLATGAIALVIISVFALREPNSTTGWVILGVGLAKLADSLSDLLYGYIQQHEQMDLIAKSVMIRGILAAACVSATIYLTHSVFAGVIALASCSTAVFLFYDIPNCLAILAPAPDGLGTRLKHLLPSYNARVFLQLLIKAGPLGIVAMLISVSGNTPRYYIEHYLGIRELGLFAAMAYFTTAANTIANALAESAVPKLAKLYGAQAIAGFYRLIGKLLLAGAAIGGAGVVVALVGGKFLLTLFYRPEYAQHSDVFVWLMVSAALGFLSTFLGTAATATRAFAHFIAPYVLFALVSAAACRVLIPSFGLLGGAWSLSVVNIAAALCAIAIIFVARRKSKKAAVHTALAEANIYGA